MVITVIDPSNLPKTNIKGLDKELDIKKNPVIYNKKY
jgi:hypothetical protein